MAQYINRQIYRIPDPTVALNSQYLVKSRFLGEEAPAAEMPPGRFLDARPAPRAVRQYPQPHYNSLLYTVVIENPVVPPTWPNPNRRGVVQQPQPYYNTLLYTPVVVDVPFNRVDWPNPLRRQYRVYGFEYKTFWPLIPVIHNPDPLVIPIVIPDPTVFRQITPSPIPIPIVIPDPQLTMEIQPDPVPIPIIIPSPTLGTKSRFTGNWGVRHTRPEPPIADAEEQQDYGA